MSQNTSIHTKQEFLKMLEKHIHDDQIIVWTQNINTVELKQKKREKRIEFGFATDAFKQQDGVNDLYKCAPMAIAICNRNILSDAAKEFVPESKIK